MYVLGPCFSGLKSGFGRTGGGFGSGLGGGVGM